MIVESRCSARPSRPSRRRARLERARALADLGALLRRRNRRTEARALLREALDTAHRSGAGPLAEYAGTELRATGARPRRVVLTGLDSLTASERRVAELASQGLTNREIAQTLFVTARTVEGHLTSVFRKLRLDSRDELLPRSPAALQFRHSVRQGRWVAMGRPGRRAARSLFFRLLAHRSGSRVDAVFSPPRSITPAAPPRAEPQGTGSPRCERASAAPVARQPIGEPFALRVADEGMACSLRCACSTKRARRAGRAHVGQGQHALLLAARDGRVEVWGTGVRRDVIVIPAGRATLRPSACRTRRLTQVTEPAHVA